MTTKHCVLCKKEMPGDALYCNGCGSFQDWRRHLKISSLFMALLVAFVALLTPFIQTVAAVWPDSPSNISISEPVFYGTKAYFVVTNSGDLTGSLEDAFVESPVLTSMIKLEPESPSERLIKPGVSQIAFSSTLWMSAGDARAATESLRSSDNTEQPVGNIDFAIRNSGGELEPVKVSISRYELFKRLTTHFEWCIRGGVGQSILNGCGDQEELLKDSRER